MPPLATYTHVSWKRNTTLPAFCSPPLRMKIVDGLAGFEGQTVVVNATSQLTRSSELPLMLNGPSLTMLPPRKVIEALVLTPVVPQLMNQFPLGTTNSVDGAQE